MIYLAMRANYHSDDVLGAAHSEDGAKRIVEQAIRSWKDWGEITWRPDTTSWEDDDGMQEYLRQTGRRVSVVAEDPDYSVHMIEIIHP